MPSERKKARKAARAATPAELLSLAPWELLQAIGVDPDEAEDGDLDSLLSEHREEIWAKFPGLKEANAAAARLERDRERSDGQEGQPMEEDYDLSASAAFPADERDRKQPRSESRPAKTTPPPRRPFVPGEGARVLDDVEAVIRKYVVLPNDEAYVAVTLWTATTHGMPAWEHATRLALISPVKGCGKTSLFEVLRCLSLDPLSLSGTSAATLFRTLNDRTLTVFHDEADTVFGAKARGSEEIRQIYNAGFSRGAPVYRMVQGPENEWVSAAFDVFAMVALASKTDDLPDTIMDRSVVIRMRKPLPSETYTKIRHKHHAAIEVVGKRLGEWVETVPTGTEPDTPLDGRAADVWEPLLILADAAGGGWPDRARQAAVGLTEAEANIAEEDRGIDMLRDLRRLWPKRDGKRIPVIFTRDLLVILHDDDDSSWDRYGYGQPITDRQLADLLRPYTIFPTTVKIKGKAAKGYRLDQFKGVSARYLGQ